jgi:hypothetical protein
MQAFQTQATVQPNGQLQLGNVPFPPGTAVEVTVSPQRATADAFLRRWHEVTTQLRGAVSDEIDDPVIQREIEDYRARR